MGFIKFIPITKQSVDITTTEQPAAQLWQQFTSIRHVHRPRGISSKLQIAPWIDQAKMYFLDADKANWKSSGLLYYYSFLNLAKAYLAAKKVYTAKKIKSTTVLHGLNARPQNPSRFTDYELQIHPPVSNRNINIFSSLYQKVTNCNWPFSRCQSIKIEDIISYSLDISFELSNIYNIPRANQLVYSLIREQNQNYWIDMVADHGVSQSICNDITTVNFNAIEYPSYTPDDFADWYIAYNLSKQDLYQKSLLRSPLYHYENRSLQLSTKNRLATDTIRALSGFAFLLPVALPNAPYWQYVPKIQIGAHRLKWHPLLSDYLISFAISTILRYHPHLFPINSKDGFIAESWCKQSAISTLRYFLMEFTDPPIRMN